MYRQLRRRFTIICTVITGIILIGMSCASLFIAQRQLSDRGKMAFQSSVNAILYHIVSQNVIDHTWLSQMEANDSLLIQISTMGKPLIYRGNGEEGLRRELLERAEELARNHYGIDLSGAPRNRFQTERAEFFFTGRDGERYYAAALNVLAEEEWLSAVIVKSLAEEEKELEAQRWLFGGLTLLFAGLLALFSWIFTTAAVRPLEENHRKQVQFVSAASHELRSPLAVIRSSLSAMAGAPPADARRFADAAGGECERMSGLIDDLLLLAGADGGNWSIHKEETEIETIVLTACEMLEQAALDKGIVLRAILPEDPLPRCSCDGQRILQLLSVLIDNGISYTPAGGRIEVKARALAGSIGITVADNGPGIPAEERERIFERFYRADSARREREHYGLGLSIAKEIVTLHRGSIAAGEREGGGTVFTVTLPCGLA